MFHLDAARTGLHTAVLLQRAEGRGKANKGSLRAALVREVMWWTEGRKERGKEGEVPARPWPPPLTARAGHGHRGDGIAPPPSRHRPISASVPSRVPHARLRPIGPRGSPRPCPDRGQSAAATAALRRGGPL